MRMEMSRTRSPAPAREAVAAHLLACDLIRGPMAEAARPGGWEPRQLSSEGALHAVRSFEAGHLYDPARIAADLARRLGLIARERAGDRPDRCEPRAVERRPKPGARLEVPRRAARRRIARGLRTCEEASEQGRADRRGTSSRGKG
jgi:hypothetical protein